MANATSRFEQLNDNCLYEFIQDDINSETKGQINAYIIQRKVKDSNVIDINNLEEKLLLFESTNTATTAIFGDPNSLPGLHNSSIFYYPDSEINIDRYLTLDNSEVPTNKETVEAVTKRFNLDFTEVKLNCNTVLNRLHFRSGYRVPEDGVSIKASIETSTDKFVFFNLLLTRNVSSGLFKFHKRPLIIGTQVFDRYIDIRTPNLLSLNLNDDDNSKPVLGHLLALKKNPIFTIEVGYPDEYTIKKEVDSGKTFIYNLRPNQVAHKIPYQSEFDKFNVVIYKDPRNDAIVYYPTWGYAKTSDGIPDVLSTDIIGKLNDGEINPYYSPEYHEKSQDSNPHLLKWCTIHELIVTEYYAKPDGTTESMVRKTEFVQTYDNVSQPTTLQYKILPVIDKSLNGNDVNSLGIQYNCRLWNKQDNTQIVRSSSIVINDPLKYYGPNRKKIKANTIDNFIIFNKKEDKINNLVQSGKPEKVIVYEKIFVDSQNIECSIDLSSTTNNSIESRNIFAEGPDLRLYPTSHYYKFRFVNSYEGVSNTTGLKAIDLSGPYQYVLRLYDNFNKPLDIKVDYSSDNANPILGELQFYIPEDIVNIVKVSERHIWSVLSVTGSGIESTLATGEVIFR